jgi:hypothetical protein
METKMDSDIVGGTERDQIKKRQRVTVRRRSAEWKQM